MESHEFGNHGSTWLSLCKVIYYRLFAWMYGTVGSFAHLAMVNSSWTQSHIESLWRIPERTKRVYPPCDTSGLQVHNPVFLLSSIYYYRTNMFGLMGCSSNRHFHWKDQVLLQQSSLLLNFVQRRWAYLYNTLNVLGIAALVAHVCSFVTHSISVKFDSYILGAHPSTHGIFSCRS